VSISLLGHYLVQCRMISSIPGFYLVDGNSPPPALKIKNNSRYCQMVPGEQNGSLGKITGLEVQRPHSYHCNNPDGLRVGGGIRLKAKWKDCADRATCYDYIGI
jgi:hypothetical protein